MSEIVQQLGLEVPIRLHYLIQDGQIGLPGNARIEVIRMKRELQAMLRFLGRWYVHLLCRGQCAAATRILLCLRSLGEVRFQDLFDDFGYPDERDSVPNPLEWQELYRRVADRSAGD